MNQKQEKQIAAMKAQTIGVEIEMNSITRENAAKCAAAFFGTERFEYTGGRNGYMTWSAWDAQGREWKFSRDSSIEGPESEKTELVTPILTYGDIETQQELCRRLRKAGAKSDATRGCGVHIHIGLKGTDGNDHNAKTLRNLANIMASHEQLLIGAIKIARSRTTSYCKPVSPAFLERLNREKPVTMSGLADAWYESQPHWGQRSSHYNDTRYHMLNLHACFTKGTIEFRLFQFDEPTADRKGGIHAGQLKSYIQLCLALSAAAKAAKNASPKSQQTDNQKYAMRTWLLRLGFIGDEFKTAREMLTRNLEGDAAFRHGRQAA